MSLTVGTGGASLGGSGDVSHAIGQKLHITKQTEKIAYIY